MFEVGSSVIAASSSVGGSWRRRARRNARPPAKHDSVRRPPSSSFRLHLRHDTNSTDRFPAPGGFAGGAHGAVRSKTSLPRAVVIELHGKDLGDGVVHRVAYSVARAITWDAERTGATG